jgi:hypothetical protein
VVQIDLERTRADIVDTARSLIERLEELDLTGPPAEGLEKAKESVAHIAAKTSKALPDVGRKLDLPRRTWARVGAAVALSLVAGALAFRKFSRRPGDQDRSAVGEPPSRADVWSDGATRDSTPASDPTRG